jgi:hypothetical protein
MRRRRVLPLFILAGLGIVTYTLFSFGQIRPTGDLLRSHGPERPPGETASSTTWDHDTTHRKPGPDPKAFGSEAHPISVLISEAEKEHEALLARQSKTLAEAVAEYRRRYGIPPPPSFDKWFAFAKENKVQLIDEFDTIHDTLKPFWGLRPKTIRARVKEALGFDNFLIGIMIRDGKVTHSAGDPGWQRDSTIGMMKKFIKHLPSMDLAFNVHDEPRVVVPHDDLARLVQTAIEVNMPKAQAVAKPINAFTKDPEGMNNGMIFEETRVTRFNVFAHQPTWTHSRMSCPVDSPARVLEDEDASDDRSRYGLGELGFVYNVTAMSDICLSPSLSESYGFFDRPNAYNIVLDLVPVFSQSKLSSYNDILYPSPWYWYNKVPYDENKDMAWEKKKGKLYWRGSTTGGFSRNGGWRRQHRQHFVRKINSPTQAKILTHRDQASAAKEAVPVPPQDAPHEGTRHSRRDATPWEVVEVPRGDYKDIVDVYFSHVGQCDPGDCDAQREFFMIQDTANQQDAWGYKYLLDIDGNAFSGRFYAFLKSRSLVFKLAFFREWHFEWLKPWAHYVPLSLQGEDWLEAVRYFGADAAIEQQNGLGVGDREAKAAEEEGERIAMRSRDWAGKVLRNEDLEVWFFRLLLE